MKKIKNVLVNFTKIKIFNCIKRKIKITLVVIAGNRSKNVVFKNNIKNKFTYKDEQLACHQPKNFKNLNLSLKNLTFALM